MKSELRKSVRIPALFCRNFLVFLLVSWHVSLHAQNCPVATNLSVVDITTSGARINFTLTPNASVAIVEIYNTASPNFVAVGKTTSNYFLLTGLASSTVYHFRIKSECTGAAAIYSTTGEFKTLTLPTTTPTTLTAKGKVQISTTGTCEKIITLDNGTVIVPVESVTFTYKDGQYVDVAYEILKDRVITCTAGAAVKITKISEIAVIPEVCTLPIILTKNSTNPVSYTFKTNAQPDGVKYYWYFGDNGTSDAASPTHTYAAGGTFTVNLKVLDVTGKVCYGESKETFLGGTVITPVTLTAKGKVKISAGSACEKMILLDNNTVVVPVESVAFTYKDGQYVEIAYQLVTNSSTTCKEGPAVNITKIAEIVVTPVTCPAATNVAAGEITATSARIKFTLSPNITSATLEYMSVSSQIWIVVPISRTSIYWDLKDLTAATKYYYRVKTVCESGIPVSTPETAYFETLAAPTCAAATILPVSNITSSSARFNFKLPAGISSAALEIQAANTTAWLSKSITDLSATYTDHLELTAATKYLYRIKTVCANGVVNYSPNGDFATIPVVSCQAATNVAAGEITATSARIKFTLSPNISSATLEYMSVSSQIWIVVPISKTSIYWDLKDLTAATKYYYRVKTVCESGIPVSTPETAYFETLAAPTCAAATILPVSNITSSSARFNFKLPAGISSAALEIQAANTTAWLSKSITDLSATYTDHLELTAATKYLYRIKTVCANGVVNYSPNGDFATIPVVSCPAATNVAAGEITATSARIKFTLSPNISSATLEYMSVSSQIWIVVPISRTSIYWDLKDLTAATKYYYRVKTICESGIPVSTPETAYFETLAAPTCAAATILPVSNITSSSVRFNFKLPAGISSAALEIQAANTTNWLSKSLTDLTATYTDRLELTAATKYQYRIKTVCANGVVNYSPIGDFATIPVVSCPAATNVAAGEITATSARIKFTLSPNITSATLEYMGVSSQIWIVVPISKTSIYWDLKELIPATKYYYRIKTVCESGIPVSTPETAYFETLAAPSCAAASNLTVSEITSVSARINFTLPRELSSASLEILATNTSAWLTRSIPTTATFYDRNELKEATRYYYRIKTVCTSGSISYTPEASFTTTGNKSADAALSISPTPNNTDLTVICYPNPVKDLLSVIIYGENKQFINVNLSNIYGRTVFEGKFPAGTEQKIDVHSFPRGIYVLKVSNSTKAKSIKIALN